MAVASSRPSQEEPAHRDVGLRCRPLRCHLRVGPLQMGQPGKGIATFCLPTVSFMIVYQALPLPAPVRSGLIRRAMASYWSARSFENHAELKSSAASPEMMTCSSQLQIPCLLPPQKVIKFSVIIKTTARCSSLSTCTSQSPSISQLGVCSQYCPPS